MLLLIETLTNAPVVPMQHATMVVAGIVGGAASVVSGIFGMSSAKKARRVAERDAAKRQAELTALENNRQAIINPYAGVKDLSGLAKDLSGMAKDLSGMISNPYANLGVATQAAKFQAEQTDMALASSLDTLRETGSSAGGATALAQAALQSKQGISASLEQQEAANEKLKAQGQQQLEQIQMSEAGRVQGIQMSEAGRIQGVQMSEAGRMQEAEVAGKQFVFGQQEAREMQKMDRVAGQLSGAQGRAAQARADQTGALTGMIGGITSTIGSMASSGAFKGGGGGTNTGQFKTSNNVIPATWKG
jgi:hypothetical protein